MATTKAPAQRATTNASNAKTEPVLVLEMTATKETAGTVRFDTTPEWNDSHGGRGTNIYIPKTAIPANGGLGSQTLRIEVYPA